MNRTEAGMQSDEQQINPQRKKRPQLKAIQTILYQATFEQQRQMGRVHIAVAVLGQTNRSGTASQNGDE
jgi:hypothetical protein